jgi:uroporphyrinogen-III synthase
MSEPLEDRTVVITRSVAQNAPLAALLQARGARVVELPLLSIEEPEDEGRERDAVLQRIHEFDWLVITSPNGAERVAPFLAASNAADDTVPLPKIAVVGEATESVLGATCAFVARPARATVLVDNFPTGNGDVVVVQGDLADQEVLAGISEKGWNVTKVVAYRTVSLRPAKEMMLPALAADVLMLASGSAASAWFDMFGSSTPPVVVSIGPSTTAVAEKLGIAVTATATDQSLAGLVAAASEVFLTS